LAIKYLKYNEINITKWDNCISKSLNCLIYAYSWYLDIVSEAWEALVEDDYVRVMPLTYDFKFNYQVVYQPFLTTNLGIFSTTPLTNAEIINFIEAIPAKFKILEINLNKFNTLNFKNITIFQNSIFSIDLIQTYTKISKNYNYEIKKTLQNFNNQKLYITNGLMPNEFINFLKKNNYTNNENNYNIIRQIISFSINRKFSQIYCIYNSKNVLVGISYFIFTNYNVNMIIFSLNKSEFGNDLILFSIDKFIQDNCDKNLTLNIDIKNFNELKNVIRGLGFQEFFYLTISYDKRPFIFKFFRKKKK